MALFNRRFGSGPSAKEWLIIGGTLTLTALILVVGLNGSPRAAARAPALAPIPPPPPPAPAGEGCGPEGTAAMVESLITKCTGKVCPGEKDELAKLGVDVAEIYGVSRQLGGDSFTMVHFDAGGARLDARAGERIRRFALRSVETDPRTVFLVFGSASPTGRRDQDVELGRRRTLAAYSSLYGVLQQAGASGAQAQVHRTNIGRDSLAADYCALLPEGSEGRLECDARDVNARRQAAFLLAYPSRCLNGAAPAQPQTLIVEPRRRPRPQPAAPAPPPSPTARPPVDPGAL